LYRGVDPALWSAYQTALVAQAPASDPAAADAAANEVEPPWIDESPVPVTERLLARGRERYGISCAPCHGLAGDGDGLVSQRALSLEQGTWVPPTSLHVDYVRAQPLGKLYDTITNGVRKMPGYKSHVEVEDRWAIALYVRALQRSRTASLDDVPPEIRSELPSN
jgi:mono/diheme cytochrome c family protein